MFLIIKRFFSYYSHLIIWESSVGRWGSLKFSPFRYYVITSWYFRLSSEFRLESWDYNPFFPREANINLKYYPCMGTLIHLTPHGNICPKALCHLTSQSQGGWLKNNFPPPFWHQKYSWSFKARWKIFGQESGHGLAMYESSKAYWHWIRLYVCVVLKSVENVLRIERLRSKFNVVWDDEDDVVVKRFPTPSQVLR